MIEECQLYCGESFFIKIVSCVKNKRGKLFQGEVIREVQVIEIGIVTIGI